MPLFMAINLKNSLGLKEPVSEIMKWNFDKKFKIIETALKDKNVCREKDYSKLLVFVCGNLDEAYGMSENVGDADIDADIFHQYSKKINIIKIKNCLKMKFKPEQIARLGNTHVIYPSLSKKAYEGLIDKSFVKIKENILKKTGIDICFDQKVKNTVYNNGVFPSQGVRPLFTTITSIIENTIPTFIIPCMEKNINRITISFQNNCVVALNKNEVVKKKRVDTELDNIKQKINENLLIETCVHEAGHALLYVLLTKTIPSQIVVSSTSHDHQGYVGIHQPSGSKNQLLNYICVFYGGLIAEEIVFGQDKINEGVETDIKKATIIAKRMVRDLSFYPGIPGKVCPSEESSDYIINEINKTDEQIEAILTEQKNRARNLITKYIEFFKEIVSALTKNKKFDGEDFYDIAKKYVSGIKINKSDFVLYNNNKKALSDFLEKSS